MKNIPQQYLDRLDQELYQKYVNLQNQNEEIKAQLENLYQYVAELNYDSKNNDSQYHQFQLQLHQIVSDAVEYTEEELDQELATISKEQALLRAKNTEILAKHQAKLKEIEKWEIKLENTGDELQILQKELKASIK